MSHDNIPARIQYICDQCSLTISDLHRISRLSRTTLTSLRDGKHVRRSTVIKLLSSLSQSKKCLKVKSEILLELRRLNAENLPARRPKEILEDLEEIILEVAEICDSPRTYSYASLHEFAQKLEFLSKSLKNTVDTL